VVAGTVSVQENPPSAEVVVPPPVQAIALPPQVKENVEPPAKPVPVAVTEVPTIPLVGARTRWAVTVKTAVAEFVPSVAATVWVPAAAVGIVNVQLKLPTLLVESDPDVQLRTVVTSQVNVMVPSPAKPVPVTVAELPTKPLAGARRRLGVTVNVAVAVFDEPSVPVTTWAPATAAGTTNVQVKLPEAEEVHVARRPAPGFQVSVTLELPA
jgi:hypothetical protein